MQNLLCVIKSLTAGRPSGECHEDRKDGKGLGSGCWAGQPGMALSLHLAEEAKG